MKPDSLKNRQIKSKYKIMEKNWDERFILEKIPKYDAYKDLNYLSLGLIKTKIRHEEKEKQKESHSKTKKLRTNSSRRTFNTKPKKAMYSPLLTLIKENEKTDLFTLKLTKRPLTIKRKKMNKTIEFNNIKLKEKNDENKKRNEKDYYTKTYENKNTYKNKPNNNNTNNNENNDSDRECIVIDQFLSDELNEIKELWNNLGVTPEYQIYFGETLDRLKTRDMVVKYLTYEKRQLIEFKSDLERLMNDIYKRENDLNNLKKMEEIYAKNEQLNQYNILKNKKRLKKIKNLKSKNRSIEHKEDEKSSYKNRNDNDYYEDYIEKSKEFDEEINKYKINKEKIENDIGNFLKLLRLHTINAVSQFTKFRINYNFYFTSGKNDVNQMKNGYEFDYNYLLKIKKDCEFFKNSSIKNIFNFSKNCEKDPFFLNLLNTNAKNSNNKYKYLTATEDTLNQIKECMFILDQEEIYFKISQNQNNNTSKADGENDNENNESTNENENSDSKIKNNKSPKDKNPIGTNFQGNLENVISKLKSQNEYKNLFFNSGETKEQLYNGINLNEKMMNKYENGPKKIPETTSKELIQNFQYYDKIKNDIYDTEEIKNIKNNMYRKDNKIVILSKNVNEVKDNLLTKGGLNLNFNSTLKKNKNENDNNSQKISIKSESKNNKNEKNNNNENIVQIDKNGTQTTENNKIEDNTSNNDKIDNINDIPRDEIECDDKNINTNANNLINKNISNEENKEKIIYCEYISILSLADKEELSTQNNNFKLGNYLFKYMNPLNLNLLINSLKINNKYSIINSKNSIIISSPEEIKNILKLKTNQNNSIPNYNSLQSKILEKDIYISEDILPSIKYAFTSYNLKFDFSQIISYSIVYNKIIYNGIKINTSNNIIQIEEDIELYTIPTNDENILIYICPYTEKIKEIIKKYDKYNNIFNGFSTFVNLISLYFDDIIKEDNGEERKIWVPCFEIDTQLICDKIPGYQKISIKNNDDNKELSIFEFDEIIKISVKPKINDNTEGDNNDENGELNMDDNDIVIENDFLFGIYHKEMKNKYSIPFISLAYVGNDNFLLESQT